MATQHKIKNIRFEKEFLFLTVDGVEYKVKLSVPSSKLAKASEKEKNNFKISTAGYGIHWSDIDEDLSVDGLIKQALRSITLKKQSSRLSAE